MGLFEKLTNFKQRTKYESEAILALKDYSGFNPEQLSVAQQGAITDSVLNQMKMLKVSGLGSHDFIALYFIHCCAEVRPVHFSKILVGLKEFLEKNLSSINDATIDVVVVKMGNVLTMMKEILVEQAGDVEGTRIYDEFFMECGFLEFLKPFLEGASREEIISAMKLRI